jgi:hypothetical protein
LMTAITTLYENPKLREELGQRGRDRVVQHFTWDHFRERLQGAYRAALQLKSNQPRIDTNGREEKNQIQPQMNADGRR